MAKVHSISTLALLFTLLTQMIPTEGRDIKPPTMKVAPQKTSTDFSQTVTADNNLPSLKQTRKTPNSNGKVDFLRVNKVNSASVMAHENDFQPTAPGISPGAGHADTNKHVNKESALCQSDKCTHDYRPTAPGDSPGAGHSFVNNGGKTSQQGNHLGVAHTKAGQTDDYRSTAPGHSPGAGHPDLKETKKPDS